MERILANQLTDHVGERVKVMGWLHNLPPTTFLAAAYTRPSTDQLNLDQAIQGHIYQSQLLRGGLRANITARLGAHIIEQRNCKQGTVERHAPPRHHATLPERYWHEVMSSRTAGARIGSIR